jgi:hypothetical protein
LRRSLALLDNATSSFGFIAKALSYLKYSDYLPSTKDDRFPHPVAIAGDQDHSITVGEDDLLIIQYDVQILLLQMEDIDTFKNKNSVYPLKYRDLQLDTVASGMLDYGKYVSESTGIKITGENVTKFPPDEQKEYVLRDAELVIRLIERNNYEIFNILRCMEFSNIP